VVAEIQKVQELTANSQKNSQAQVSFYCTLSITDITLFSLFKTDVKAAIHRLEFELEVKTRENAQLREEASRKWVIGTLQHRVTELEEELGEGQEEIRRLKAELRDTKNKLAHAVLSLVDPEMDYPTREPTQTSWYNRRKLLIKRSTSDCGSEPARKSVRLWACCPAWEMGPS